MNAERSDIGASLAADPEHSEVSVVVEFEEFRLVDGPDTELTLYGGDQWGALKQGTSQGLKGAGQLLLGLDLVVKTENADVFLSCTMLSHFFFPPELLFIGEGELCTCSLLGLDEARGTVNADDKAASNLGV